MNDEDRRVMAKKVVAFSQELQEAVGADEVTFIVVARKGDKMVECAKGEWVRDIRVGIERVATGRAT